MKLFIAGNSHVGALARAYQRQEETFSSAFDSTRILALGPARFELSSFSRLRGSAVELVGATDHARFVERSGRQRIESGDDVWCLLVGLHTVNIVKQPFWQTHHPTSIAGRDAAPVSDGLCHAIVDAAQRPVKDFLLQLVTAGVHFLVVSSPPLRRDHPGSETCPPQVALKLDGMARERFTKFLAEHGIDFVDYPSGAVADDGFLRDDLRRLAMSGASPDLQHANNAYGATMLKRVIKCAEKRFIEVGEQ